MKRIRDSPKYREKTNREIVITLLLEREDKEYEKN